ncbi:DUF2520 domain-containing protein [Nanchangia anserum]|uniref:DUF2520 domain-containing protein n=1 Tax=Nanchangia anserum TaxID=2692125 RepID=A0A8I0GFS4_9ACTO|nr:DUF2520 domain-containing protein [Nanchangia anserum]MBD3690027.1 DUF2520 domain-containing protein [Nanchangia anserum]QOX82177.1 DUF2520 domain-containing protein [Nanchangia anserum]
MSAPGRLRQGIIGESAAAITLATALHRCGHVVTMASVRDAEMAERLDALAPGVRAGEPGDIVAGCDLVWIAADDARVGEVARELARAGAIRPGILIAHACAGIGLEPLEVAESQGATVLAFTPLAPLDATSVSVARLSGMALAVTARAPFLPIAQALATEMGAMPVTIDTDEAPIVHEAARLALTHVGVLLDAATRLLGAVGVDNAAAIIAPLLESHLHAGPGAVAETLTPQAQARLHARLDRIRLSPLDEDDPEPATDALADVAALIDALEGHLSRERGAR